MSNSPQAYAQQIIDGCTAQDRLLIRFARDNTLKEFVIERCPECVQAGSLDEVMSEVRIREKTGGM